MLNSNAIIACKSKLSRCFYQSYNAFSVVLFHQTHGALSVVLLYTSLMLQLSVVLLYTSLMLQLSVVLFHQSHGALIKSCVISSV